VTGARLQGPELGRWDVGVTVQAQNDRTTARATLTCRMLRGRTTLTSFAVPIAFDAGEREHTASVRTPVMQTLAPGTYDFECADEGGRRVYRGSMRVR
jgi:hypothetical protein